MLTQYSLFLISFKMEVARTLSSQKPGLSESCLSAAIFSSLLATSKKPPQDQHTVSHILQIFCSHAAKLRDILERANELAVAGPQLQKG
jgi:hypothetical protein